MKRILIAAALILICGSAFADNSAKIKELEDSNKDIKDKAAQAQQYMKQLDYQFTMNQGAIQALTQLDIAEKEKAATADKKKGK